MNEWTNSGSRAATGWADSGTTSGRSTAVRAPIGWLAAAAVCAGLSVLLGSTAQGHEVRPFLGWLFGGAASIGLLTAYSVKDAQRRTDPWYAMDAWPGRARIAVLVLAAAGVALNAWWFADSISRTLGS